MEVILLERIAKLGQMGDVVRVKDGFARNFLLPQGKALRANEASRKRFERDKAQLEARNLEARKEAEAVAEKLTGQTFVVLRQAGETGQLYGSVSTRDIAEMAERRRLHHRAQPGAARPRHQDDRPARGDDRAPSGGRGADHHQRRPLGRRGGAPGARRGSDAARMLEEPEEDEPEDGEAPRSGAGRDEGDAT